MSGAMGPSALMLHLPSPAHLYMPYRPGPLTRGSPRILVKHLPSEGSRSTYCALRPHHRMGQSQEKHAGWFCLPAQGLHPWGYVLWGYVCILPKMALTHGSYLRHYFVGKSNACFASLTSQSLGHPWTPPHTGTSSLSFPNTPTLLDASYLSGLRVQTPESSPLPLPSL